VALRLSLKLSHFVCPSNSSLHSFLQTRGVLDLTTSSSSSKGGPRFVFLFGPVLSKLFPPEQTTKSPANFVVTCARFPSRRVRAKNQKRKMRPKKSRTGRPIPPHRPGLPAGFSVSWKRFPRFFAERFTNPRESWPPGRRRAEPPP